jgi:hypothetical protein
MKKLEKSILKNIDVSLSNGDGTPINTDTIDSDFEVNYLLSAFEVYMIICLSVRDKFNINFLNAKDSNELWEMYREFLKLYDYGGDVDIRTFREKHKLFNGHITTQWHSLEHSYKVTQIYKTSFSAYANIYMMLWNKSSDIEKNEKLIEYGLSKIDFNYYYPEYQEIYNTALSKEEKNFLLELDINNLKTYKASFYILCKRNINNNIFIEMFKKRNIDLSFNNIDSINDAFDLFNKAFIQKRFNDNKK